MPEKIILVAQCVYAHEQDRKPDFEQALAIANRFIDVSVYQDVFAPDTTWVHYLPIVASFPSRDIFDFHREQHHKLLFKELDVVIKQVYGPNFSILIQENVPLEDNEVVMEPDDFFHPITEDTPIHYHVKDK